MLNDADMSRLVTLNNIFTQEFLGVSTLDQTLFILLLYKLGIRFSEQDGIHDVLFLIGLPFYSYHYYLFLLKSRLSFRGLAFLNVMLGDIANYLPGVHYRGKLLALGNNL